MASKTTVDASHPLDPLSPVEIEAAVGILRKERGTDERFRFVSVALQEPGKEAVRAHRPGRSVERRAFAVLLDREKAEAYEAIVSLNQGRLVSW
ncbi:MAG: hypothetical protein U0163_21425, partial [Gemmatimonadaceae bacterium]